MVKVLPAFLGVAILAADGERTTPLFRITGRRRIDQAEGDGLASGRRIAKLIHGDHAEQAAVNPVGKQGVTRLQDKVIPLRDHDAGIGTGEGQGDDLAAADGNGADVGNRLLDAVIDVVIAAVRDGGDAHGAGQAAGMQSGLRNAVDGRGVNHRSLFGIAGRVAGHQLLAAIGAACQQLQAQVIAGRIRHRLPSVIQHENLEDLDIRLPLAGDVQRIGTHQKADLGGPPGADSLADSHLDSGAHRLLGVGIGGCGGQGHGTRHAAGQKVTGGDATGVLEDKAPKGERSTHLRRAPGWSLAFLVLRLAIQIVEGPVGKAGRDVNRYAFRGKQRTVRPLHPYGDGISVRSAYTRPQVSAVHGQEGLINRDSNRERALPCKSPLTTAPATAATGQEKRQDAQVKRLTDSINH